MRRAEMPLLTRSLAFFLLRSSFKQIRTEFRLTPRNAPSLESRLARILFPRNRLHRGTTTKLRNFAAG